MLEEKRPFKISDGPMIMLIAFAAMLMGQVIFALLSSMLSSIENATEIVNLVAMIAFQGIYIGTYFIYVKQRNIKSAFDISKGLTVWSIVASVAIAAICFFCFSGLAQLFETLLNSIGYVSVEIETSSSFSVVLLAIATVIIAPIGEETIFRKALLSGAARWNSDVKLCLLSGVAFAMMHINPSQTVYQFFLGSVAAYVMLKCGNVLASMMVHGVSNLLAILFSYTDFGSKVLGFYAENIGHNTLITFIFCAVLPICAIAFIIAICRAIQKAEKNKFPEKFKKVLYIDQNTLLPVYDGIICGDLDIFRRRAELRKQFIREEKSGAFGKRTYEITLAMYFMITALLWIATFAVQLGV